MSKDKRFLNMALAIHKIAFSVDDETLNKIDPYLKEIESIINSINEDTIKLQEIERITRAAFNNPETQDINLYRAQALANILAVFEYNGATIKREEA